MNGTNGTSHDAKIEVIKIKNKIRIDYSLWYGLPARIVAALYNCSASMTRTSMCGQTILPKDIFKFDSVKYNYEIFETEGKQFILYKKND